MSKWNELKSWAEAVIGLNKTNQWDWVASVEDGRLGKTHTSFALAANPAAILELIAENERAAALNNLLLQISNQNHDRFHVCLAQLTEKTTECDQLRAEVEALKADAERYRFARHNDNDFFMLNALQRVSGDELDEAIDAAMQEVSK